MPLHPFQPPRGSLETITIESTALAGNLLGDPTSRQVAIYLPEGYESGSEAYPLFVDLAGFTGSGLKRVGWNAFSESVPQRLDRLVAEGKMGPVVLACPDAFSSLGGNQYVDSISLGLWERFVLEEMLPVIESRFRVRAGAANRAVYGKSSGGYGALVHGMRHGECWGAIASHSGDVGFDMLYRRDFPMALDTLARHGGSVERYLAEVQVAPKLAGHDFHVLMLLAMAASYDPDPDAPLGIRLPLDVRTGRLDPARWQAWLAHDPLTMIESEACQASLRKLRGIFIDCGSRDQYFIHYGTRALVDRMASLSIAHRHEEFDDTHSGVEYRLDRSLPFLYAALMDSATQ